MATLYRPPLSSIMGAMSAASDSRTVARAASVNLLGMAARSSKALVTLFITRVAGPGVFGLFTLALAVVDIVGRLALFGMDKSLLKFVPEARDGGEERRYQVLGAALRVGLVLSAALSLGVAALAPWIAGRWLSEPRVALPLAVVAVSIVPTTLAGLFLAATKALKIMRYDAFVTGMLLPASLLILAIPILWIEDDLLVLAAAYAVTCLVGALVSAAFYRRHFSLRRSFSAPGRDAIRRMVGFSTPLGLHDFVQFLSMKLELFILAVFVAPASLGVYALAAELSVVMRKFRQIFDPILIPLMSEAQDQGDTVRLQAHLARVVRWVLILGVFWLGILALFPRPLLALFGDAFAAGAVVVVLLCVAQLLNAATGLLDMAMLVSGRPRINLQNATLVLVSQTALNLWLVPRHGILGAGWAAVVTYGLVSVVRLAQTAWMLRLSAFDATQLKPVLAGLGAGAAVWGLGAMALGVPLGWGRAATPGPASWIPLLVTFALLYAVLLRLQGFEAEDADLARAVLRRRKRKGPARPV